MTTNHQPVPNHLTDPIDVVCADYEALMHVAGGLSSPGFVGIDISMAQAKALLLIAHHGPMSMSALAERLGVVPSTASGLVDKLVEQRLVDRRSEATDRRHVVVTVTAHGQELLDRFREFGKSQFRVLLEDLDARQVAVVGEAIRILLEHLSPPVPVDQHSTRQSRSRR